MGRLLQRIALTFLDGFEKNYWRNKKVRKGIVYPLVFVTGTMALLLIAVAPRRKKRTGNGTES